MIIIIEGIDRVGKTTLANKIVKEFGYGIFKDNPVCNINYADKSINTEKINILVSILESGSVDNIVIDRGHFTEYVYGKINRNYTNEYIVDFDERLSKIPNLLLIYVKPENIERSSAEHGSNLAKHNILMDLCIKNSKIKNIIVTSYNNLDNTINQLKTIIANERI